VVRTLCVSIVAVPSLLIGRSTPWTNPDACKLLSAQEAAALIGPPLVLNHTESNTTFSTCAYHRPNQNPPTFDHVEVHYYLLADASAAQAKFQRVVHPGPMEGTTITTIPHFGDEADIKRTPNLKVNSIEFQNSAQPPLIERALSQRATIR